MYNIFPFQPFMNLRIYSREPEENISILRVALEVNVFSRVMTTLLSAALPCPTPDKVSPPVTVEVKCVMKHIGQRVGDAGEKRRSYLGSAGSGNSLYIRIEMYGSGIQRKKFEVLAAL